MLSKKIVDLLNNQVNKELFSAYLYLDFANYYEDEGLQGFANWYRIQAQEERDHAFLFMKYLQNNSKKVVLEAIENPSMEYASFDVPLEQGLIHEQYVTSLINTIYEVSIEEKDFRTKQFLYWFIEEQGEEETNAEDLINKYKLFAEDGKGLYLLDSELGARVYTAPSLVI